MTSKTPDFDKNVIVFSFEDDGEDITFDLSQVSEEIRGKLALHGASQKIGDSYAGAKSATKDSEITPSQYARAQVAGVIKQLLEGDWTVRRTGGLQVTDLAKALSEVTGATLEECVARLSEAEKEEKAGLRKDPRIKAVLDRISAERAKAKAAKSAEAASGEEDEALPDLTAFVTG